MNPTDDTPQPLLGVVTPNDSLQTPPDPVRTVRSDSPTVTAAPPSPDPVRVQVLREAAGLITGDRQQDYGEPSLNFQRIADLWTVQAQNLLKEDARFTPTDVALLLLQLKMARAVQSPKRDTFVDAAGYAALAAELSEGL